MIKTCIRIATRKSALALWQANYIKDQLTSVYPQLKIELLGITTTGDKNLTSPLNVMGGKGLFVKELENALLENQADIAVHSMKDVPMEFPKGLDIMAICKRADPRDSLICNSYTSLTSLPAGSVIGTSSLRRLCQLRFLRPDLNIQPLRGNVDTRLKYLDEGKFSAIILAVAGLQRLGLQQRITEYLSPPLFLPAVGQGALGIECRINDRETCELIKILNDEESQLCVNAERALNAHLEGGCQVPIAAYARLENNLLHLQGMVGSLDGQTILRTEITGPISEAKDIGIQAAEQLIKQGAKKILAPIINKENGFES